ncbi:hypothetical protein PVW53_11460 [Seohaeicola sp. SP36]|uniref:hypothetical protein n=1 Tax=unclassified Seohaeicola TaxID=2641111 RepID=UPI00237A82AE|nr:MULTISPECIES: hypothetical protein [unclassified Seohaeicola]MDD9708178.1 hypothetical protein [Seohaeicola sp. 4SK31]MDD9736142.1 hypothetical protein [Seohaeicola sp. SP36]
MHAPLCAPRRVAGARDHAPCLAAIGLDMLSMRPASIGPVKSILRRTNLAELRDVIRAARPTVMDHLTRQG